MTGRTTVWVGVVTTLMFGAIGISLLSEGQQLFGGVILGLGCLRALVLVRQYRSLEA